MDEPPALAGVRAAQAALDAWLARLSPVDPGTPSALPGWTVGHVLTHVAANASSHVRMLAGQPQYPGGDEQRNGDIDAGAARPWGVLLADLHGAHAELDAAWEAVDDWEHVADLPMRRWREVEVHRVDLGLGYTFADLPGEYVRRDLAALTMRYRATRPIGLTQLPEAAAAAPPHVRLAWLLGRHEIPGLPTADVL